MRVCHVCSGHQTDDGRVFRRACAALAAAGYDVHLIAVGKEAAVYRDQEVTIHPLPQCRTRRERLMRRSRVARMASALAPDLFHVHEPELLAPVLACARSRPVVYDVHESFLDVLMDREWIPRWLRPAARLAWDHMERRLVQRCAGVVVANPQGVPRYQRIHPRVRLVANYPDLAHFQHLQPPMRDGSTCVYAGVILRNRGVSEVIAALGILKARGLMVRLDLAGPPESEEYLASLWEQSDRLGVRDRITYHGFVTEAEAHMLVNRASIGLVPHLRVGNNLANVPVKMLECMALGLPVVYSDFPHHHEIAGVVGAGIAVEPDRPEQIADAVEYLVQNPGPARQMGEAGRAVVLERFNWSTECLKLLGLYREILRPQARSEPAWQEA
jgi:glycosyltransferase involved in cell wall biosynthesis